MIKHDTYTQMFGDIMRTADWIDHNLCEVLKDYDLTHIQFNVLRILNGAFPKSLRVGEIKEKVIFSKCDMTRLLDRLLNKEMIERAYCENNRRHVLVNISEKGRQVVLDTNEELRKKFNNFFKDLLEPSEVDALIGTLKKIRQDHGK